MSISKISNITGYGQIASGKRINRAADDAAGLAIANKLKVNAQGTKVATQNTQAGIHVTNIADGAYDSIMDRLQSIRELSIKAMNGTNSASDLQAIQSHHIFTNSKRSHAVTKHNKGQMGIFLANEFNQKALIFHQNIQRLFFFTEIAVFWGAFIYRIAVSQMVTAVNGNTFFTQIPCSLIVAHDVLAHTVTKHQYRAHRYTFWLVVIPRHVTKVIIRTKFTFY